MARSPAGCRLRMLVLLLFAAGCTTAAGIDPPPAPVAEPPPSPVANAPSAPVAEPPAPPVGDPPPSPVGDLPSAPAAEPSTDSVPLVPDEGPAADPALLSAAIDAILDADPLDRIHFGVLAVDASTGRVLHSRNAGRKFIPASNQKVLLTSAALSLLGPDYRFRTGVWATGSTSGQPLDGNLVVVASGDPSWSRRFWGSGEAALDAIADSLAERELRHVTGSVFVDVSAWDSASVGPTREVEDLRFSYGATGGAFAIDEGEIRVAVRAGEAVGSSAAVSWRPLGTDDFVTARIETAPSGGRTRVRASFLPESHRLLLEGEIGLGEVYVRSLAIRDPVRQAAAALGRSLMRGGIAVEEAPQIAWVPGVHIGRGCLSGDISGCPNAVHLFDLESPPLSELAKVVLEVSQNWISEQLVRALGTEIGEEGSWDEGISVMRRFLVEEAGVDSFDIAPRDGSGLSAYNLATPRALVAVLGHMRAGPLSALYRDALAAPGKEDSTLERRLLDLEGRVFAKTGTISNVNSLSGYLVRSDGSEVIFSILSNGSGMSSGPVRAAIDDVVRALAR